MDFTLSQMNGSNCLDQIQKSLRFLYGQTFVIIIVKITKCVRTLVPVPSAVYWYGAWICAVCKVCMTKVIFPILKIDFYLEYWYFPTYESNVYCSDTFIFIQKFWVKSLFQRLIFTIFIGIYLFSSHGLLFTVKRDVLWTQPEQTGQILVLSSRWERLPLLNYNFPLKSVFHIWCSPV